MLPRLLWVNDNITLFIDDFRKSHKSFDANIGSLTVKSFFFTGQLDFQPLQIESSCLRNEDPVRLAWEERVVTDLDNCLSYAGMLAKLGKKEPE